MLSLRFLLGTLLFIVTAYLAKTDESQTSRDGKLLFPFQVVRFRNEACSTGSGKNGTCYTANECSSKGGANAGSCAGGFGVCCTFSIGCGMTSSENCTYIQSTNPTAGDCRHTICPCSNNICQLRLDFDTFVIAGPSTLSASAQVSLLAGNPVETDGQDNTLASRCLTDTFSVTNSAGRNTAPICGVNTGEHMYVDVDRSPSGEGCNTLDFQLGRDAVFTTIPNRQWNIKVSQIECDSPSRAPDGCTQYFLGNSDVVRTYNYAGGQHLAFQQQTICVRRSQGQCRICWTAINPADFAVSATHNTNAGMGVGLTLPSKCCGYSEMGKNEVGYDCVQIPGAMKKDARNPIPNSRICGRSVGLVSADSKKNVNDNEAHVTLCSTQQPFSIQFISDGYEEKAKEIAMPNKGFQLLYTQDNDNCAP